MNSLNFLNLKSVASGLAALTLTVTLMLAVSWVFSDTVKLAHAEYSASQGAVASVSALVR